MSSYRFRLHELERNHNFMLMISEDIKQIIFDIYDGMELSKLRQHFNYQYDYDKNGIIWYLATNGNTTEWINPATNNKVCLLSAGWIGRISEVLERDARMTASIDPYEHIQSHITIDFGDNIQIKPTAYTIRHAYYDQRNALRSWIFCGYDKHKAQKVILKQYKFNRTFNKGYKSHTFKVKSDRFFKRFSIVMTGKNSSGYRDLHVSGLEIYGEMISLTK